MSTVYACVRVIAETIASLPLHVYQNQGEGSVKALDHPLYPILHDEPNSEMTSFVWRETMLAHLLLWGNAYCQIIRSGRSQILGLYPLLPDRMEVDRDSAGTLTYTYSANGGQTVKLRPEDVLHIPGLGFDGIMGYSPIALEKNAIGLGLAAEEYGSKFFSNGAPQRYLDAPQYGEGSEEAAGQLERRLRRLEQLRARGSAGREYVLYAHLHAELGSAVFGNAQVSGVGDLPYLSCAAAYGG